MRTLLILVLSAAAIASCAHPAPTATAAPTATSTRTIPLPGAVKGSPVWLDYIAADREAHRVWVPAGSTGSLDAIDTKTGTITRVEGFKTAEFERNGHKRTVGPSSVTIGDGVVYAGNRADSSVCAVDPSTMKIGACAVLDSSPDGLAWVDATKEVWVTTPRDKSVRVLDGKTLAQIAKIPLDGEPEGYAVDGARGVFYTNLEDADRTLSIDLHARKVTHTWKPDCGESGPKGLAIDHPRNVLFVACPDHVIALDVAKDGALLDRAATGDGVDNLDYLESKHALYVAGGRSATLTIVHLGDDSKLRADAPISTAKGARNAAVDANGDAYLADSPDAAILVVPGR